MLLIGFPNQQNPFCTNLHFLSHKIIWHSQIPIPQKWLFKVVRWNSRMWIKCDCQPFQCLYSLSGRTSYGKISRSLEAARFVFKLVPSLWNLTSTSAAPLPRCLLNIRAIRSLKHPISRLRDFARFGGKTSYRLVNRGTESEKSIMISNELHGPIYSSWGIIMPGSIADLFRRSAIPYHG